MATSRVIVQSGIAGNLISAIKNIIQPYKAGDVQSSADMGALFSEGSANNAVAMIKEAQADGAEVILGDVNRNGAVIQPHLVKNVAPGMRLWDREVFGPGECYELLGGSQSLFCFSPFDSRVRNCR